jgi:hypothetical protein
LIPKLLHDFQDCMMFFVAMEHVFKIISLFFVKMLLHEDINYLEECKFEKENVIFKNIQKKTI